MKSLVIVESPTKARTIQRFLNKDYQVLSSFGHIRDLPKSKLGVDEEKDFAPQYIIPAKARKTVSLLKKEAENKDVIILATDEDREGEAIAWHITKALGLSSSKRKAQSVKQVERIVFHEITPEAIESALKHPREIDMKLVDAQQARRILDRIVGYKISPFLWKKIARGLSAGRVQSVAVRLICEREDDIKKFKSEEYWNIEALLKKQISTDQDKSFDVAQDKQISTDKSFLAKLDKVNDKKLERLGIKNKKDAEEIKKDLEKAKYCILNVEKKAVAKNPFPPYTTSSLQQDAAIKLRFSSKKTMFLAQKLYEGIKLGKGGSVGLITYMRTDSLNMATSFLEEAQKYLKDKFSQDYIPEQSRHFKTHAKGAQEAHEAIRPTSAYRDPETIKEHLDQDMFRLYQLIWQRAIASQMNPALFESTKIMISAQSEKQYELVSEGQVQKFDGFLKVYPVKTTEKLLPEINQQDQIKLLEILAAQKFTEPPARYTEAMLIKTLEKYGIGRPSTYAPTITTIQTRGYVEKNEDRRFMPTEIGAMVNNLLVKHFNNIVDYDFTAKMEKNLDEIADGKKEWIPVIREFYDPFMKNLKEHYKSIDDKDKNHVKVDRKCPKCGSQMVERFSRFGKFIACSNYPTCKYIENNGKDGKNGEPQYSDKKCPKCQGRLVFKRSRFGQFLGCENYPKCKHIENGNQKTGVHCPACTDGEIVQKRTKKKRIFYACDQYPKCKFALWQKPTGEKCPECGALLMEDLKKKVRCSSKLCDYKVN